MNNAAVFLVEGFEPIEAIGTIDILRRGGVDVSVVSLTHASVVTGAHNISITCDEIFDSKNKYNMLILPGGPGTVNYLKCYSFLDYLNDNNKAGTYIGAICAAPSVLGKLDILQDKKYTCYPTVKDEINGIYVDDEVVIDKKIITSKGPNTTFSFALTLLGILTDEKNKNKVSQAILKDIKK